jgi:predicted peptidase
LTSKKAPGKQNECVFEQTIRLGYLLFLPDDYKAAAGRKWPLIFFLHGMGERGNDLNLLKVHGIPKIVENRPDFPFVSVSPQCPDQTIWSDHHGILRAMLDEISSEYAIDERRIYLTGLSMGGYGTWSLSTAYPELFAAIAPICGGGCPQKARRLRQIPVWAFHGERDDVVKIEESRQMVEALRACGGTVRFTVYPGVGHDAWTRTYENHRLYAWFLQHRKTAKGANDSADTRRPNPET